MYITFMWLKFAIRCSHAAGTQMFRVFQQKECLQKAHSFVAFTIISVGFWEISATRVYILLHDS